MLPFLNLGGTAIASYSACYAAGILLGSIVILALAARERLDVTETASYVFFVITAALLGAKLSGAAGAVLSGRAGGPGFWKIVLRSGGVFYGGLAAGLAVALLYAGRYFRARAWALLDVTAIGVALGHAVGRVGCFLGGCCYGRSTALPWGVRLDRLGRGPHPTDGAAIHPTQLYEAALNLLSFAFLAWLRPRRRFDGEVASFYLVNYGVIRFAVEWFRGDDVRGFVFRGPSPWTSLSVPQAVSLALIAGGILLRATLPRKVPASSPR